MASKSANIGEIVACGGTIFYRCGKVFTTYSEYKISDNRCTLGEVKSAFFGFTLDGDRHLKSLLE